MLQAPIPENEQLRIAALNKLNILDTAAEERFDRIIRLAQWIFDVPICTLSLVDSNREWFKSCVGVDIKDGPRDISFCGHAVLEEDLFIISDTKEDPRFADNPMVTGKPYLRFYAGQSLASAAGVKIGTLCIKDTKPRVLTEGQKKALRDLALWAELEINSYDLSHALEMRKHSELELRKIIGELNRSNEDLKQAQISLVQSEKLASIGQLAAGIAHEINNPIGFISNNVDILQEYVGNYTKILSIVEKVKMNIVDGDVLRAKETIKELRQLEEEVNLDFMISDVNKLLEHTVRGLERVRNIVLNLRTFAREDRLETEDLTKIEDVIESILGFVQSQLKYKAEIIKEYGDTPLVRCNVQNLGQVFMNLLVNAVQSMDNNGRITIKTYLQDTYVCVDVADTGKGIPEENLKKIFNPFFTTKPVGQGTGLGLCVSYEIVKKHAGELKVRSKVGEGTTFTVMLPYQNDKN